MLQCTYPITCKQTQCCDHFVQFFTSLSRLRSGIWDLRLPSDLRCRIHLMLLLLSCKVNVQSCNAARPKLFVPIADVRLVSFQCPASTNRLGDVDIYAFEPASPADTGTLNNVAVNSIDEVLKSLLRADLLKQRCIAGWEDHKANLPRDPTQVLSCCAVLTHSFRAMKAHARQA